MPTTNATVVEAPIDISDPGVKYADSPNPLAVYSDYTIYCKYISNKHKYMLGITSPNGFQGARAAFVELASPTLLWVADWTALQSFETPKMPDPDPRDPNWILLDESYEPTSLVVYDDGSTPAYRISGTYVYGCVVPETQVIRNVSYPRPAWLDDAFERTIPTSALTAGLIKVQVGNAGDIALG